MQSAVLDEFESFMKRSSAPLLGPTWREDLAAYIDSDAAASKRDCERLIASLRKLSSITLFDRDEKTNRFKHSDFPPLDEIAADLYKSHFPSMMATIDRVRKLIVDSRDKSSVSATPSQMTDLFDKAIDYYVLSLDISASPIAWAEAETRFASGVEALASGKPSAEMTQQAGAPTRPRQVGFCGSVYVLYSAIYALYLFYIDLIATLTALNTYTAGLFHTEGALGGLFDINIHTAIAGITRTTVPPGQNPSLFQQAVGYVPVLHAQNSTVALALSYATGSDTALGVPVPGYLFAYNELLAINFVDVALKYLGYTASGLIMFIILNKLLLYMVNGLSSLGSLSARLYAWYYGRVTELRSAIARRPPDPISENDVAGYERLRDYYNELARQARERSAGQSSSVTAATSSTQVVERQGPVWLPDELATLNPRRARENYNDDNDDDDEQQQPRRRRVSATRSED